MVLGFGEGTPLARVDAAWWRMEHPTNLMTIIGVMSFPQRLEFPQLKELIEDRLLCYDRFRQRVVESTFPFGRPCWVEDQHFNLRHHLLRVALPNPGGKAELQEMVSILMSTPLDYTKPLWQFQYIENYREGSALVARLHHCIADGIALVRLMLSMTDDSPAGSPAVRRQRRRRRPLGGGSWMPGAVNDAVRSMRRLTKRGLRTVLDPDRARIALRNGATAVSVAARLAAMPPDPDTLFRGNLCTRKVCAWSENLPLDDVKVLSKKIGATINDVLLAGVTGALRSYMVQRRGKPDGLDIRAVVPVNLRPDDEVELLGNRFGLVFLALPIGIADRGHRLRVLKQRMDAIKGSAEAVVTYSILDLIGMTTPAVETQAVRFFGTKATAVMTNVPGPRKTLYLAGSPVRSLMFWVPQSARLGMGVSIISYDGQVRLGVVTDSGLVPDPDSIIALFDEELRAMMAAPEEFERTAAVGRS